MRSITDRAQQKLHFVVSDTGPGMTREQAARIFQTQDDSAPAGKVGEPGLGWVMPDAWPMILVAKPSCSKPKRAWGASSRLRSLFKGGECCAFKAIEVAKSCDMPDNRDNGPNVTCFAVHA